MKIPSTAPFSVSPLNRIMVASARKIINNRPCFTRLSSCRDESHKLDDQYVWLYDGILQDNDDDTEKDSVIWHRRTSQPQKKDDTKILHQTWRWCQDFVVPLDLCPWAAASVASPGAMQFYMVSDDSTIQDKNRDASKMLSPDRVERIVRDVAERFVDTIQNSQAIDPTSDLSKVGIAFVVLRDEENINSGSSSNNNKYRWYQSFPEFYQWFIDVEDEWIDQGEQTPLDSVYNLVTLAAFHPDWEFGTNPNTPLDDIEKERCMNFEKQSPHPTITLVWTGTIEAAGQQATERIAEHNQKVLQEELTLSELQTLYDERVMGGAMTTEDDNDKNYKDTSK